MNKNIFAHLLLSSATYIIITGGCAKISTPSGGPRDRTPPVVIKSIPENGAKNFRDKNISIIFNEYVVLDNINEKFMVSPPMKKKPRVFLKGKSVNVELEEPLKDSTTYTFYFQDAIRDLNEGNILENYQFVFSTGPVIDSLSVTGNVFNSFDLEVPEKTQVLLYRNLADSAVIKLLPEYISRVDDDGYFRINNVRPGNYRLYALKDDDNSKNYNRREEAFAFMDSAINVSPAKNFIPAPKDTSTVKVSRDKNPAPAGKVKVAANDKEIKNITEPVSRTGEYQLYLFIAQRKDHYLAGSSRNQKYELQYILSLPPDTMKFEFSIPSESETKYFIEKSKNQDTITVWLKDSTLYSQQQIKTIVKYPFTDTLGVTGYKVDTVPMRFTTPRASRASRVKKPVFKVESNIAGGFIKPGQPIEFLSLTPFRQPDTSRMRLYELIDTVKHKIPFHLVKDNNSSRKYTLDAGLLPGGKYLLISGASSFGNIYDENSDSTGTKFTVRKPEDYGKLIMDISDYEGDRIVQLLNNTEKLVRQILMDKNGKAEFPLIDRGYYRIRVIYDLNDDGQWTTGDFTLHRQPEPVSYYFQELEVKVDWILEQPWDIRLMNVKDPKLRAKRKTK